MGPETYSNIFKAKSLSRPKKFGSGIAGEVARLGYRMKEYQTAWDAVSACADVREELIAPIKEKIQEGTYQIDANDIAEKLWKKYKGI